MAQLTEPVKLAIVQALACFDTPSDIAAAVKEDYGVVVTRQQVAGYDPTKGSCKGVAKKLREVFTSTRKAFLEDVSTIPIAQQAVRLRALQREFERAKSRGNSAMVAQLLEQAAKECGGALTNRREHTGKNGGPIQQASVSAEELKAAVTSVRDQF
jgi:hypothetical protein